MKRFLSLAVVIAMMFMLTACDIEYYVSGYNGDFYIDEFCDYDCCYDCCYDCDYDCCDNDCIPCETPKNWDYFTPGIGYAPMQHPIIGRWRFVGFISRGEIVSGMNSDFHYIFLPNGEGFTEFPERDNRLFSWALLDMLTLQFNDGMTENSLITYIILDDRLIFVDHGPPCQEPFVFERVED